MKKSTIIKNAKKRFNGTKILQIFLRLVNGENYSEIYDKDGYLIGETKIYEHHINTIHANCYAMLEGNNDPWHKKGPSDKLTDECIATTIFQQHCENMFDENDNYIAHRYKKL